ncbi:MAG: peptidoglycan DD-metalloendopeptidase family protein [Pseudomonadota bacterium]
MTRWKAFVAACALALATPATGWSQSTAAEAARAASAQLERATLALAGATEAEDRISAQTEAIRAFENGLSALRDAHRRTLQRTAALEQELEARSEEMSRLLSALQAVEGAGFEVRLLHPSGPLGTARASMLMGSVAQELQVQADRLRADLDELATLRALRDGAEAEISTARNSLKHARSALAQAAEQRTDLPRRIVDTPESLAVLVAGSETLAMFADGLAELPGQETNSTATDFDALRGKLALPVVGPVLLWPGEPNAAGVTRPGVLIAARPGSPVTAPFQATARFVGPLLDYGNVIILEPAAGYLLVLAGVDRVFAEVGQVLPQGAPVGLMATNESTVTENGGEYTQTLYVESRRGQNAVDPTGWFALNKE